MFWLKGMSLDSEPFGSSASAGNTSIIFVSIALSSLTCRSLNVEGDYPRSRALQRAPVCARSGWVARLIAPHQLEKTKCVAHGMNLADLVGVNSRDGD